MAKKYSVREIHNVHEKLDKLRNTIKHVTNEIQRKEEELHHLKSNNNKELHRLATIENKLDMKVNHLDSEIEHLETKLKGLNEELVSLELASRNDVLELKEVVHHNEEEKKHHERKIHSLKKEIEKAKEDLTNEKIIELDLIQNYEDYVKKIADDFDAKLNKEKEKYRNKYKIAMDKFKAKMKPLLDLLRCIQRKSKELEEQIDNFPSEIEKQENRYGKLMQKLGNYLGLW